MCLLRLVTALLLSSIDCLPDWKRAYTSALPAQTVSHRLIFPGPDMCTSPNPGVRLGPSSPRLLVWPQWQLVFQISIPLVAQACRTQLSRNMYQATWVSH